MIFNFNIFDQNNPHKINNYEEEEVHTSNIGTSQYAAPEQLKNTNYDNKVDIYSLGLILLELFFAFSTRMEKQETQDNLRNKRIIPKFISERFPQIGELILLMTEPEASKRPNILNCRLLFKSISDIFKTRNNLIVSGASMNPSVNQSANANKSNASDNSKLSYCANDNNSPISTLLNTDPGTKFSNSLSKSISSLFDEKRRRFLSEDISSIRSHQLQMKTSDNEEWKVMYIYAY